jgi:uncharacterized membrane protein YpjA
MLKTLPVLWSRYFLLQPWVLWTLFWFNALGTIYGYIWYGDQLVDTWQHIGKWLIPFVPDSPTASLFFTITLLYLIWDKKREGQGRVEATAPPHRLITLRGIIEGLCVITQVKYGIWAVSIIFWGAAQGHTLVWQQWMLVVSHTCMALEALLYMRFYRFTALTVAFGALWTLLNDTIDYSFGVFPWLPRELWDDLPQVRLFTVTLSALGIACAYIGVALARKNRV